MKIHKIWRDVTEPRLQATEALFRQKWAGLTVMIGSLDHVDFDNYTTLFQKQAINPVDSYLIDHLYQISYHLKKSFDNNEMKDYITFSLKLLLKVYYRDLYTLRQANLCMICDYDSQKFINTEIHQMVYKQTFCKKLTEKFLKFHDNKYNSVMKYFMLIDEWIYLTSGRTIFLEGDKELFRRYLLAIEKCKGGGCDEYCSEYNVNEINYLFDGEPDTMDHMDRQLTQFMGDIGKNSRKYFAEYNHKWDYQSYIQFRKHESVLSTFSDDYPRLHQDEFAGFSLVPSKSFIERIHKINSIEIETLDDLEENTALYRTIEHPIDLSEYQITFEFRQGIDFFDLAKRIQIKITVNKFMALLNFQTTISRHIPEILTDRTKAALKSVGVLDAINFKRDYKMRFKTFRPKSSTASAAKFFPRRRGVQKLLFQLKTAILGKPAYPHPNY